MPSDRLRSGRNLESLDGLAWRSRSASTPTPKGKPIAKRTMGKPGTSKGLTVWRGIPDLA
ncbi:MAG: hypothetical protein ACOYMG_23975 [Candidatus Methylumidiphilus sp.]